MRSAVFETNTVYANLQISSILGDSIVINNTDHVILQREELTHPQHFLVHSDGPKPPIDGPNSFTILEHDGSTSKVKVPLK